MAPVSIIENLLLLYIGALLIGVLVSGLLYYRDRSRLHRSHLFVWASSVLTFASQGALDQSAWWISIGFSSAFLVSAALAHLISTIAPVKVPWRLYLFVLASSLGGSSLAAAASLRFELVTAPVAIAVALPLLHTAMRMLRAQRAELSTTGRALVYVCLINGIHLLDFPFLRNDPELALIGFTIALLNVFALSITAPGVVLEKIAEERSRIREIDRLKTQFFANTSHELRTPLTVILASIEHLLLSTAFTLDDRKEIEIVRRNAVRLLRLIDEMLDLSKIDAGGLRLNITELSLRSLVSNLCENNLPLANAKSIEIVRSYVGSEIDDLHGDPHRIEMVIANLLGNALKYTPKGGRIEVIVGERGDGAFVSVSDDGPGIPKEQLPNVFDRFVQLERTDRRQGGVGIGLALAKELTEMHEGTLTVTSEVDKGSTFTMWLPKGGDHFRPEVIERRQAFVPAATLRRSEDVSLVTASPTPPLAMEPTADLQVAGRRPRILVVEDQDELRAFMARIFSASFEVLEASDGAEGWERTKRERPDLVVSDVMMPNRLGTDLCYAIKSDPLLCAIPVILLTARVGSEATLEAYAHGADDFVAKPFHPQVLLARVRAQLQIRSLALQVTSQEKLAAIGTLAAGVAHEIRNPLNFILNASTVLSSDPEPEVARELLGAVVDGARRIDGIVAALSTHARPSDAGTSPTPFDVREGLEATLRLLSHRTKNVELTREYQTDRLAWAPPGPVNQILMNLVDNAVKSGASKISLRLLANDDRIRLQVADNGPGVPEEIAQRIFDPFFTTRPPGEGTGLGLYLSRKIASDCGGSLTLKRPESGGAEFQLDLPQVPA